MRARAELPAGLARGLPDVPPLSAAAEIATMLRTHWNTGNSASIDLQQVLELADAELTISDLGGGEGGPQGLLLPLDTGGFRIEADPSPPEDSREGDRKLREETIRHRLRFIVMHELAHTLFYRRIGGTPERLARDSDAQERFCDALASALLIPPAAAAAMPLHPESVLSLHRIYDVSVEVATRALIEAHDEAVGWLMVLPADQAEPWVQWGAEKTRETVGPWGLLTRLAEHAKHKPAPCGHLRWRSGRTTVARGLYLAERRQLVVTARAA